MWLSSTCAYLIMQRARGWEMPDATHYVLVSSSVTPVRCILRYRDFPVQEIVLIEQEVAWKYWNVSELLIEPAQFGSSSPNSLLLTGLPKTIWLRASCTQSLNCDRLGAVTTPQRSPVTGHPLSEKSFHNAQSELPLTQLTWTGLAYLKIEFVAICV